MSTLYTVLICPINGGDMPHVSIVGSIAQAIGVVKDADIDFVGVNEDAVREVFAEGGNCAVRPSRITATYLSKDYRCELHITEHDEAELAYNGVFLKR